MIVFSVKPGKFSLNTPVKNTGKDFLQAIKGNFCKDPMPVFYNRVK